MKYPNYTLTEQENYILTEHEKNRSMVAGKHLSALEESFPNFGAACVNSKHMTEWAHLEAYSKYSLSKIRDLRNSDAPTSTLFFSRSRTHETMFYRLLLGASIAIQNGDARIGVSLSEVLTYMTLAELKSDRSCRNIVKQGLDESFIMETRWGMDERVKVVFLSPTSIMDYLRWGFESHYQSATDANLPNINASIKKEKDDKQQSLHQVIENFILPR